MVIDPTLRTPSIEIAVSWDGSGTFTGPNDILIERVFSETLAVQYGRDSSRPLGEPLVPNATWTVSDRDRLLAPEWAGSPIYQQILPGRPTRVLLRVPTANGPADYEAAIDYDDAAYYYDGPAPLALHAGLLENLTHDPALGMPAATFSSIGNLGRAARRRISSPVYATKRTDECVTIVLDLIGWPAGQRDIAVGDTTLDWFWVDDEPALDVLVKLQHSEGGASLIWEGGDGVLHFEGRNYRDTTPRATTSQVTFSDHLVSDTAIRYHSGISYDQAWAEIVNEASLKLVRRARQSLQKIWEYGSTLTLAPGESRLITAQFSDPSDGLFVPQVGTDFSLSAGSLTIVTFDSATAQRAGLRLIAGGSGATILGTTSNGIQIRGTPITVVSEANVKNTIDTSTSIAHYDPFSGQPSAVSLGAYPEMAQALGEAICDAAVTLSQDVRPIMRLRALNIDAATLTNQASLRPSDRMTVWSGPLGLDGEFHVETVEYRLVPEGFESTFTCRFASPAGGPPVVGAAVWDSPTAIWDDPSTIWGT